MTDLIEESRMYNQGWQEGWAEGVKHESATTRLNYFLVPKPSLVWEDVILPWWYRRRDRA